MYCIISFGFSFVVVNCAYFTPLAKQQRANAPVSPQVPESNSAQMFICDDWLSRDTPSRKRQFARLRMQQRRLELLMGERSAEVAKYKGYINGSKSGGDMDTSSQSSVDPDSTLGRRLARINRVYRPSPLNPAAPSETLTPKQENTDKPAANPTVRIKPIGNPRVCRLRDADTSAEDRDDVALVGANRKGTPRLASYERIPRSPLPPKEK